MLKNLSEELAELGKRSLKRSLRVIAGAEEGRLVLGDQTVLNLSSNNYLGLARHPQVLAAAQKALARWGAGATSSRLISGSTVQHESLEKALADFLKTPASLVFPTGYMANLGVMTSLVGAGDAVILDRLCHASLIDAARLSGARLLVYRHGDAQDAEKVLRRAAAYRRRLLATESVFSMDGDFAPLEPLRELCRRYDAISLVDEAHAIGVWGQGGRGMQGGPWDVIVGTLSKSLGSQGGFVAGSHELVNLLVNKARPFIFTTGLSPVCCAAAQAALEQIQTEDSTRLLLQDRAARLREGLRRQGWDTLRSESHIVPILLGSADRALACAEHLLKAGIYAPAIRPPTVPRGECRLRFSLTAEHSDSDIEQLLQALRSFPIDRNSI